MAPLGRRGPLKMLEDNDPAFGPRFAGMEIVIGQQVAEVYDTFGGDIKRCNNETNGRSSEHSSFRESCFKSSGQMRLSP